jgi:hypothetical protein
MVIEIELGSMPIGGTLYDSVGIAHPFSGWMEIASVLQAAIEAAQPANPTPAWARVAERPPTGGETVAGAEVRE